MYIQEKSTCQFQVLKCTLITEEVLDHLLVQDRARPIDQSLLMPNKDPTMAMADTLLATLSMEKESSPIQTKVMANGGLLISLEENIGLQVLESEIEEIAADKD